MAWVVHGPGMLVSDPLPILYRLLKSCWHFYVSRTLYRSLILILWLRGHVTSTSTWQKKTLVAIEKNISGYREL